MFMIFTCPPSLDISSAAEIALSGFTDKEVLKVFTEYNSNKWIVKVSNNFRSLGSYRISSTLKNTVFNLFPNFKNMFNSPEINDLASPYENSSFLPIPDSISGDNVSNIFYHFAMSHICPTIVPFSSEIHLNSLCDFHPDDKTVSMPPLDIFYNVPIIIQKNLIPTTNHILNDSNTLQKYTDDIESFIKSSGDNGTNFEDLFKLGYESSIVNEVLKNLVNNFKIIKVIGQATVFYLHSDHVSIWGMDANEVHNRKFLKTKNNSASSKKLFSFEPWMSIFFSFIYNHVDLNGEVNEYILNLFKNSLKMLIFQYPGNNSYFLHTIYPVLNPVQIDYICSILLEAGYIEMEDSASSTEIPKFLSHFLPAEFYPLQNNYEFAAINTKRYYPNFHTLKT